MSKNLIHLTLLGIFTGLVLSGPALAQDPNLVGWWKLDGDAEDASGNGRHGTLMGDPQFGPGVFGQALVCDGIDDYVNIDGYKGVTDGHPWSVALWFKIPITGERLNLVSWGATGSGNRVEIRTHHSVFDMRVSHGAGNVTTASLYDDAEWHHLAVTVNGTTSTYPDVVLYFDGVDDTEPTSDADPWFPVADTDMSIGRRSTHDDRFWNGSIDEVAMYDKPLTPEEVQRVMAGDILPPTGIATKENPVDEATDVPRNITLSWTPGQSAVARNVYLGTVFEDVNDASVANPRDALISEGQDANSVNLRALAFGQTYYWRVDEISGPPDRKVSKGETWRFEVEPFSYPITNITATASSAHNEQMGAENTVNGSGLDGQDLHSNDPTHMWLSGMGDPTPSIQFAFDRTYKLDALWVWNSNQSVEAFVGLGAKDVTIEVSADGTTWTRLENVPAFAQASGLNGYAHNTVVALDGAVAQYVKLTVTAGFGMLPQYGLSELRFFYTPTQAREPQPEDGAINVALDTVPRWRSGREAASHQVSLGTDPDAVAQGNGAVETAEASYDPGTLDLATTYYWRVVEVNQAETPSSHASDLWSFSTQEFIVVDDFEGYNDNCDRIFFAWKDGLGHSGSEGIEGCTVAPSNGNGGGSIVGHAQAPFAEQVIVHGGSQSMPLAYDNAFGPSETTLTLNPAQDWTSNGVKGLVLWFAGDAASTGSDLYVKINNTKVSYDGPADSLTVGSWQKWYVDLQGLGGNLSNVSSLAIGIGNGQGMIYVDDIVLSPHERQLVTPINPDPANLLAHFAFDGNANDSVGGLQGTLIENASYGPGQQGQALSLNMVTVTDYVEIKGYKGIEGGSAFTIALWLKTAETIQQQLMYFGTNNSGQRCEFRIHDNGHIRMGNGGGQVEGFTDVTDDQWHHVVITVTENATNSSSDVRIYVDGRDDTQESADLEPPYDIVPEVDVAIGYRPSQGDRFLIGQVDELYIYNRVLSAAEVAGLAGVSEPFDSPH